MESATSKALQISSVLDQIISELHWNCCGNLKRRRDHLDVDIDVKGCGLHSRGDLHRCLLVSKLWAYIAIPMLWSAHARLEHLMEEEWKDYLISSSYFEFRGRLFKSYSPPAYVRVLLSDILRLMLIRIPGVFGSEE